VTKFTMMAYVGASQHEHARKTGKGRDGFPHTITEQLAATWQREGGPRPVPRPIDGTPHRPRVQGCRNQRIRQPRANRAPRPLGHLGVSFSPGVDNTPTKQRPD